MLLKIFLKLLKYNLIKYILGHFKHCSKILGSNLKKPVKIA